MLMKLLILSHFGLNFAKDVHVLMTEVFEIEVNPPMFNWTYEEVIEDQYVYQASLLNAPDLPSWINFVYSKKNHSGFLYGVPPKKIIEKTPLEIVALNRRNYETRIEKINIVVSQKLRPAKYEVHMKIDNLNVEDMFDVERMKALKVVFREQLWRNSENDLYLTFLSSATELGARKPLVPSEKEGIVIRLGSYEPFSVELQDLQEEVRPLWKVPSCQQYAKRTSVERIFRDAKFTLDWCSFRLLQIDNNNSGMHQPGANEKLLSVDEENLHSDYWQPVSKSELPQRGYFHELLASILVPMSIMIVLASILSIILCFHHDDIENRESEEFFENLFHICTEYYYDHYIYRHMDVPSGEVSQLGTLQRATESIRSFSKTREMGLSPDPMLLSRSHTNSPSSTISRGVHCRPSPPPYVRPKFKPEL